MQYNVKNWTWNGCLEVESKDWLWAGLSRMARRCSSSLDQSDQPGIPGIRVAMATFDVSATQPLPLLQGSYEWVGDPVDASWKSARIVTVNCAAARTSPVWGKGTAPFWVYLC